MFGWEVVQSIISQESLSFRSYTLKFKHIKYKYVEILTRQGIVECVVLKLLAFLCPRHSKNGGGSISVTNVRASVRPLSKFGVRSITFDRLHRFNSNLVC